MIELVVIAVLVVVFVVSVFIVMVARESKSLFGKKGRYPEGHFISLGLIFGISAGLPLGVIVGNVAFGPSIGLAAGLLVGALVEDGYRRSGRIRSLTKQEKIAEGNVLRFILIAVLSIVVIVSAVALIFGIK
jgi:hypothetical protein